MRTFLLSSLALCLLLGPADRVRGQEDLRVVIDKAIKAHGGQERIDKVKAGQTRMKGTIHLAGKAAIPFTQEMLYQWPNQFKAVMEIEGNGQKFTVTTVSNGDKGWINDGQKTQELEGKALAEMKEEAHLARLARLTGLKDKTVQLSGLGESKVDGRPAVGVKVTSKGHRDVSLYFDKASGLLVKTERQAVDVMSGRELSEEKVFSDYQEVDGLQSAKKVVVYRDGKKFMEVEVVSVKFLDKLDPGVFAKP
jgi:hypothetical protein